MPKQVSTISLNYKTPENIVITGTITVDGPFYSSAKGLASAQIANANAELIADQIERAIVEECLKAKAVAR